MYWFMVNRPRHQVPGCRIRRFGLGKAVNLRLGLFICIPRFLFLVLLDSPNSPIPVEFSRYSSWGPFALSSPPGQHVREMAVILASWNPSQTAGFTPTSEKRGPILCPFSPPRPVILREFRRQGCGVFVESWLRIPGFH